MATTRPLYTKLTCPTHTTGARGLPRFHGVGDEEPPYDMRETLRSLANWKKHKLCLLSIPLELHLLQRLSERTTSLQSATDNNGTPATWTLVLFQQAIDRQDRILQTEGRFSLQEPLEYTLDTGIPPLLPDKDSSNDIDDMPCRTPIH